MGLALADVATKQLGLFFYSPLEDRLQTFFPSVKKEIVYYPESDGKPMADNTKQFNWIVKIKEGFELLFANDPDVFIAGDLLWYPVEGNNKIRVAPDTMIVFGRPKGDRGSYRSWDEEDIDPQIVFEILSPGNRKKEMDKKLKFYEQYKVEEYYVYDPYKIIFTAYIRSGRKLNFVETVHGWDSPRLNVHFKVSNKDLRIFAPDGREFISPLETSFKLNDAVIKQQKAEATAKTERQIAGDAVIKQHQAEAIAKTERQIADDAVIKQHQAEAIAKTERQTADDAVVRQHEAEAKANAEYQRAEHLAKKLKELGIVIEL